MDPTSEVKSTEVMLTEYQALYGRRHPKRSSPPPFPTCSHDLIHCVLDFVIHVCPRIRTLLEEGHSHRAAVLARPCLEWGLRLLWCRTQQDGWQRLVSYLAAETLKAVDEETRATGHRPIYDMATSQLRKTKGQSTGSIPPIPAMLREIEGKQNAESAKANVAETYGVFFRGSLHQVAHANFTYMAFDQTASDRYRIGRTQKRISASVVGCRGTPRKRGG